MASVTSAVFPACHRYSPDLSRETFARVCVMLVLLLPALAVFDVGVDTQNASNT